jgi:DNA-cytosine methyltransferase
MNLETCASICSGGGGWELGAIAAGLTPLWAVEYDPLKPDISAQIADCYELNIGAHVIREDVRTVDFLKLCQERGYPDIGMASPPCPNFSGAKVGAEETEADIDIAHAVCRFIRVARPHVFFLENVRKYRESQSFKLICQTLEEQGYWWDSQIVNTADFGVPQTRERLIVRANWEGLWSVPPLPAPAKWVGWYEAVEDILHTLPESKFADWQLKRLPPEMTELLMDSKNAGQEWGKKYRAKDEPTSTVTAIDRPAHFAKAFLTSDQRSNEGKSISIRQSVEPALTVDTRPAAKTRAFLMDSANKSNATVRSAEEPMITVETYHKSCKPRRAFLVDCTHRTNADLTVVEACEPSFTVAATHMRRPANTAKAFLVDGQANSEGRLLTVPNGQEPTFTVQASADHKPTRAWLQHGRVVQMTVRALARFQTFPDWYQFPDRVAVACRIIGNAVPPLLAQKLIQQFLEYQL